MILKRLIRECPEEKEAYTDQLESAQAVYREAVKETAVETGFVDEESPIIFYHSFEPEYAEVICRLLEDRFRAGGGRRQIEFRWQEPSGAADIAKDGLPAGILEGGQPADNLEDRPPAGPSRSACAGRPEIGDICCCDLPTMHRLYHSTGNISAISPFIDTDGVIPALLEQGRIKGDVCGLPVLLFAEPAEGTVAPGKAGLAAGGASSGERGSVSFAAAGAAAEPAEGFQTVFAVMNHYLYGLKGLDCLNLMILMTDRDFLNDVCMACNAGGKEPRVFPADRTVHAGLTGK